MRKLIWLAILLPTIGWTSPATTTGGLPACLSEDWLEDMADFAKAGDQTNWNVYLALERCFVLKRGLSVTITGGGLTGYKFVFAGTTLWIPAKGLIRR